MDFFLGFQLLVIYKQIIWLLKQSGPIGQLVASLTADPGVASSIFAQSHTFVEIDHEIISAVILVLPLKVCAQSTG